MKSFHHYHRRDIWKHYRISRHMLFFPRKISGNLPDSILLNTDNVHCNTHQQFPFSKLLFQKEAIIKINWRDILHFKQRVYDSAFFKPFVYFLPWASTSSTPCKSKSIHMNDWHIFCYTAVLFNSMEVGNGKVKIKEKVISHIWFYGAFIK